MERPAAGHVVEVSILIKQSILSLSTQLSNCFSMFILVSSRGGVGWGRGRHNPLRWEPTSMAPISLGYLWDERKVRETTFSFKKRNS